MAYAYYEKIARINLTTGPLTGAGAPSSGRYMVVTKSPLTGMIYYFDLLNQEFETIPMV